MKRYLSLLLSACVLLSLASCAETPDDPIVAQKNSERLVEAAQAEPEEGTTLGEVAEMVQGDYDYHYQNEEGTLSIDAGHVTVTMPAGEAIPMYRVSAAELSQEFVTRVYDFFFPEGGTYAWEGTPVSKASLEEEILRLQKQLAQVQADDTMTEEARENTVQNIQETIDFYQAAYEDAPEEATLQEVKVDSTLTPAVADTVWGDDPYLQLDCYYHLTEDDDAALYIRSYPADSLSGTSSIDYWGGSEWEYYSAAVPMAQASEEEIASVGISYEEAKALSDRFFQAVGVDAELHDALLVAGFREDGNDPYAGEAGDMTRSEGCAAFKFVYTRLIGGVEQAAVSSSYDYTSTDLTAQIWKYETIEVYVEADGISRVSWDDLVEVGDAVSDNVGILSFDDAADIFEQMSELIYQGELDSWSRYNIEKAYEVTVTDARLCLMRVRDSGGARTGVLTPAWVFYGEEVELTGGMTEEDAALESEPPYILMAINAVDGSIIDLSDGY